MRNARCCCGKVRPSAERERLALFEDRSPGTQNDYCAVCRYHRVAHERDERRVNPDVPKQCQHPFVPMVAGYEFDTYYCGHGG
jgi:hypothetical protein